MRKIIVAIILTLVIILSIFNNINKEKNFFGLSFYQIVSNSMNGDVDKFDIPSLEIDDFVIVKNNTKEKFYYDLCIGDVITFEYKGVTVSHRIIQIIIEDDNDFVIKTQGDNNTTYEVLYSESDVIYGKIIYSSKNIGNVINFVSNNIFILVVVGLICLMIVVTEGINLYKILRGDTRTKY